MLENANAIGNRGKTSGSQVICNRLSWMGKHVVLKIEMQTHLLGQGWLTGGPQAYSRTGMGNWQPNKKNIKKLW